MLMQMQVEGIATCQKRSSIGGTEMEDGKAWQLANQKEKKMEQMVGMMAEAEVWNEERK